VNYFAHKSKGEYLNLSLFLYSK